MYSWGQRKDCSIVDEPLYAHYLRVTDANHPGKEEIMKSQSQYADVVIRDVILRKYDTQFVIHKQMTHHLVEMDWSFMKSCGNIILIRNPKEIIASYSKVIPNPSMKDVGVKKQTELYDYLKKNNNLTAIVDTNQLLKNPEGILRKVCSGLGMPFDPKMLSWKPGARSEDGVWAKYWYANVHQSIGFKPYVPREIDLPEHLEGLAEQCLPYYRQLFKICIKA